MDRATEPRLIPILAHDGAQVLLSAATGADLRRAAAVASAAFVASLSKRRGFTVDVIKDRGALARQVANGAIENVYRPQISNALNSLSTTACGCMACPD